MFIIRRAKVDDSGVLHKLARMVHFINLPPDKDIIQSKIIHSRNCFLKTAGGKSRSLEPVPKTRQIGGNGLAGLAAERSDLFMFVLEDDETNATLGTSQLLAHMGGEGNPNVSFRLEKREFFSKSLQTGSTQTVAILHLDESGPTEIGGLILQPSYRGHKKKLGRFLSLVRFHWMGLHRDLFSDHVLAEMMAPITPEGDNLLWDYLGRRFVSLSYDEADRFCQYSREFVTALLPKDPIYLSLLPPQARALVGEVGPETVPARRMLEKLGFSYHGFIDPFDGGPHLTAQTDEITVVRDTRRSTIGEPAAKSKCKTQAIVSTLASDGEFRALDELVHIDDKGRVCLPRDFYALLHAEPGMECGVTPLTPTKNPEPSELAPKKKPKKPAKKARKKAKA